MQMLCLVWILSIRNTYAYIISISMLLKQCIHNSCSFSFLSLCIFICNECELQGCLEDAERMPQNLRMIAEIKHLLFLYVSASIVHRRRFIYCKCFEQLKTVCADHSGWMLDGWPIWNMYAIGTKRMHSVIQQMARFLLLLPILFASASTVGLGLIN